MERADTADEQLQRIDEKLEEQAKKLDALADLIEQLIADRGPSLRAG